MKLAFYKDKRFMGFIIAGEDFCITEESLYGENWVWVVVEELNLDYLRGK